MDAAFFAHLSILDPSRGVWFNAFVLFWALLVGHCVADFPLQGDFLATGKDRHADLSAITGGRLWPDRVWLVCLTVHAIVHSGVVWALSGSLLLGLIEFVLHWVIDFAKCEKWTGFYTDQALHVVCKAAYLYPVLAGIMPF